MTNPAKHESSAQETLERFEQPHEVDDVTLAFPAGIKHLMPRMDEIPDDFERTHRAYIKFQQEWFFSGIPKDRMPTAKPGIDIQKAMRHLKAIQGSFEPKHEHKEVAVAYLASRWLDLKPPPSPLPSSNQE